MPREGFHGRRDLIAESSTHLIGHNTSLGNRGAATGMCFVIKHQRVCWDQRAIYLFFYLSLDRRVGLQERIQHAIRFPEEFHSKVAVYISPKAQEGKRNNIFLGSLLSGFATWLPPADEMPPQVQMQTSVLELSPHQCHSDLGSLDAVPQYSSIIRQHK